MAPTQTAGKTAKYEARFATPGGGTDAALILANDVGEATDIAEKMAERRGYTLWNLREHSTRQSFVIHGGQR